MSTVRVIGGVADLMADLERIAKEGPPLLRNVVVEGCRVGNSVAKDNARRTSGRHGKHYPNAFSTEMRPTYRYGDGAIYSGEYGPVVGRPQGGMEFEWGSRNQPPHLDLNKSADLIGPALPGEVGRVLDELFW